jgi:hypothetical protein
MLDYLSQRRCVDGENYHPRVTDNSWGGFLRRILSMRDIQVITGDSEIFDFVGNEWPNVQLTKSDCHDSGDFVIKCTPDEATIAAELEQDLYFLLEAIKIMEE